MKYKVGDKVKIKSLEWYNQNKDSDGNIYLTDFGIPFIKKMSVFCGRKAVIASIFGEEYKIDIDKNRWYWKAWMLEDDSLNEADSNSAELKETIGVIKEKRFQAACSAMNGIVSGLMQSEEWHGWTDKYIAERSYLLADELLKQGGYTE